MAGIAKNDPYWGSHTTPMERVFASINPTSALELGMGEWSTIWFLAKKGLSQITSLEDDLDWFEKCKTDDPRHECVYYSDSRHPARTHFNPDPRDFCCECKWLIENKDREWDVCLNDGVDRANVATLLMNQDQCKVILCHDFEASSVCYHWHEVIVPEGWGFARWIANFPETGIFAKTELLEQLAETMRDGLAE